MNLTAQDREQIRLSALRYCEAAAGFGLMEGVLLQNIRNEGLRSLSREQLGEQLHYLESKNLIAPASKIVSPELRRWCITAAGMDLLAQNRPLNE